LQLLIVDAYYLAVFTGKKKGYTYILHTPVFL